MINLVEKLRYTPSKGISVWGDLQARADAIEALTAERDTLRQQLAEAQALIEASRKQEPVALIEISVQGGTTTIDNHFIGAVHKWPTGEYNLFAEPAVASDVQRDAERYRWLDKNTTFMDVDNESPVALPNVPVLASVSNRIWYHATDDATSYPLSAVVDAAMKGAA